MGTTFEIILRTMKEQAAYSLLHLSGKADISRSDVEGFMNKCGVKFDAANLDAIFNALKDTTVKDACVAGKKKNVSMPAGGARAAPAGGAAAGAAAAEAPKEEVKEEEEDVDMGGLFGGDDDDY